LPRIPAVLDGGIYRPIVDVTIRIDGNDLGLSMLVDSGADACMLAPDLVTGLTGKTLQELAVGQESVVGVGGRQLAYWVPIDITYEGKTCVTQAIVGASPTPLLGREGFFESFSICFDWATDPPEVLIEPN
jgi:hypothetical protein